jgi:hypothetical protein
VVPEAVALVEIKVVLMLLQALPIPAVAAVVVQMPVAEAAVQVS